MKLREIKTWENLEEYIRSNYFRKFYFKDYKPGDINELELILYFFFRKLSTYYKRGNVQCYSNKNRSYKEFFKIYFTYFPNNNMTDCLLSLYNFQNTGTVCIKSNYSYKYFLYNKENPRHVERLRYVLGLTRCPDISAVNSYNFLPYFKNNDLLNKLFYTYNYTSRDIPKLDKSIKQYLKDKNEITE